MYRRILVGMDGSEPAEGALRHAAAIAERFGALLILLHVTAIPAGLPDGSATLDRERREADRYLTELQRRLTAKGLMVHFQRAEGGPVELIAEYARDQDAGLIILGVRGRGGRVFGSVAEAVVRSAQCPVFLVNG